MKPNPSTAQTPALSRDSLTEEWRQGKITTREFHHQWVAMAVRSSSSKRRTTNRTQS